MYAALKITPESSWMVSAARRQQVHPYCLWSSARDFIIFIGKKGKGEEEGKGKTVNDLSRALKRKGNYFLEAKEQKAA